MSIRAGTNRAHTSGSSTPRAAPRGKKLEIDYSHLPLTSISFFNFQAKIVWFSVHKLTEVARNRNWPQE